MNDYLPLAYRDFRATYPKVANTLDQRGQAADEAGPDETLDICVLRACHQTCGARRAAGGTHVHPGDRRHVQSA